MMSNVKNPSSLIYCVVGAAFFIFANLFTFERIHYGVNFFDEAFYSSVPFRFLLGQKLFVDDLFLVQTFGLISYPLLKLHSIFYKGTDGLIFFMRFAYFILSFLLGLWTIGFIKQKTSLPSALIIAGICGLFLPGGIPTVSYNTLGTFFLTIGLFSLYQGTQGLNRFWFFLSGVSMGLCSLSYVTFTLVSISLGVVLLFAEKDKRMILSFLGGFFLVTAVPGYLLLTRLDTFKEALYFSQQIGYSPNKAGLILEKIHKLFPAKIFIGLTLYVSLLFFTKRKGLHALLLVLLSLIPILSYILAELSWGKANLYPFYLCLFGIPLFLLSPRTKENVRLVQYVLLPSILSGMIAMFTSAIGHLNVQVGLLPAVIVSLLFLWEQLKQAPKHFLLLNHILLALPILIMMSYPFFMWDESPKEKLNTKVLEGPYRNLYTSPEKKLYLSEVSRALSTSANQQDMLLVYPNFSAGYLIAGIKPAPGILSYQHGGIALDSLLAKKYRSEMTDHSRILKMNIWYAHPDLKAQNSFDDKSELIQLIKRTHYPVEENKWFTLLAPLKKDAKL